MSNIANHLRPWAKNQGFKVITLKKVILTIFFTLLSKISSQ